MINQGNLFDASLVWTKKNLKKIEYNQGFDSSFTVAVQI